MAQFMLSLLYRVFRSRSGNLPMIFALLFLPMTLMIGGSIDLVAHERLRVALQNALDRGTLAAASLSQTQEAKDLIKSFLKDVPGAKDAVITVTQEKLTNFRKVSATASFPYATTFMKLAQVDTIQVNARSTAQESRQNVELSLVLDISGSMVDNGGMTQLRPAAKAFLATVLKDTTKDFTSVNLIPFSGGVNIGDDVFNYLAGPLYTRRHTKSSCFELLDADFYAGTPIWTLRDQFPHFTVYNYNVASKKPWWCPTKDVAITYMTNSLSDLQARVDAMAAYDGTGTAYGMKWAELLLNPSMKSTLKAIADKGLANNIPSSFSNRPAAFNDSSTLKFIVLMTDGQIGPQPRPFDPKTNEVTDKNIGLDKPYARTLFTQGQSSDFYKRVCSYAKDEDITIFTIAFKVDAATAANIATCASNPSYAYKVDGLDMSAAFQSIATTMQKIRIVE